MMRKLNVALFMMNLAMLAAATYFVVSRGYVVVPGAGWSPVEIVTTVLAALAILITVLGIFVAVLAVWGYARLAEEARSAAAAQAIKTAQTETARMFAAELERWSGGLNYGAAAAQGEDGHDKH